MILFAKILIFLFWSKTNTFPLAKTISSFLKYEISSALIIKFFILSLSFTFFVALRVWSNLSYLKFSAVIEVPSSVYASHH